MFIKKQGKTKIVYRPVTASTEIDEGSLVAWDSGKLIAATSTTAGYNIVGVLRKTIESTDSDYADERLVPVEVPVEMNVIWEADVTAGLVAADKGLFQDLTSSTHVDRGNSTYDVVQCVDVISSTKGEFILNIGPLAIAKS